MNMADKVFTQPAAHIHAATYRLLCLIREFDTRGGWGGVGGDVVWKPCFSVRVGSMALCR